MKARIFPDGTFIPCDYYGNPIPDMYMDEGTVKRYSLYFDRENVREGAILIESPDYKVIQE